MRSRTIAAIVLLLLGLTFLSYPLLLRCYGSGVTDRALQQYGKALKETDWAYQKRLAENYNALCRAGAISDGEAYRQALNIVDGILGILSIPAIELELPIYHGTGEDVLAKGAGHLPGTALPVGGKGNHTVLTGHTGYPQGKFFTDLTRLKVGDTFSISVLGETLHYQVDQILTVLPEDTSGLDRDQEKDYCTLVTCTPYGINSHRLLVRGIRIETEP